LKRVIWKFEVPAEGQFTVELPTPFHILTVQMQDDKPQMWVSVNGDRSATRLKPTFVVIPTGRVYDMPEDGRLDYVGTFQPAPGLVFHLFWIHREEWTGHA